MKVTLAQAKANTSILSSVGITTCSDEFLALLNEAQQLLVMGPDKWWNLTYKYRVAVTDGLVTWPREIATVEAIAACGDPMQVRNEWFEFIDCGFGLRDNDALCSTDGTCRWDRQTFDRGMSCLFSDIDDSGDEKKLKFYTDAAGDAGETVTFHGLDWDGNNITETLTLAYPGAVTSTNDVSVVQSVILPGDLTGPIRLYEYDTVAATQRAIAIYQGDETVPSFRRSYVGGLCQDGSTTLTVMAKREFIPARNDTDVLMLGSLPAIKLMMKAIQLRDRNAIEQSVVLEAQARDILDKEAQHYLGTGVINPLRIQCQGWGAQAPVLY